MSTEHILPKRTYYTVFAILIACTYLTWQVAYFDLGALNAVVALGTDDPKPMVEGAPVKVVP